MNQPLARLTALGLALMLAFVVSACGKALTRLSGPLASSGMVGYVVLRLLAG